MTMKLKPFKAQIWIYPSESASWHFVTLPSEYSETINNLRKEIKKVGRDFGTVKVNVSADGFPYISNPAVKLHNCTIMLVKSGLSIQLTNCTIVADPHIERSFRNGDETYIYRGPVSGWMTFVDETVKHIRKESKP